MNSTNQPVAAVSSWLPSMAVLGAIWGSSFLLIKVGVSSLHPIWVSAGRVSMGALALALILLVVRQGLPRDPIAWWHNGVVGVLNSAVPFTLLAYAEQRIPSTLAGIWNATTPLLVLPLAVVVFRTEVLTLRRLIGLVLGLAGVLIILGVWQINGSGADLIGQLLCLATTTCYAFGICWTRKFISPRPEAGLAAAFCQLIVATAVLIPVSLIMLGPGQVASASWQSLVAVAVLGALGTGIAFLLHLRNIKLIGASAASAVTYLTPLFAAVIGVLILHERLLWYQPLGALVVLLGVAVAQGAWRPQPPGSTGARPCRKVRRNSGTGSAEQDQRNRISDEGI